MGAGMSWAEGQEVAIITRHMPDGGYRRVIVTKVHKDGGCKTSNGARWTKSGGSWGTLIADRIAPLDDEFIGIEREKLQAVRLKNKRQEVHHAVSKIDDMDRLELALVLLRGES